MITHEEIHRGVKIEIHHDDEFAGWDYYLGDDPVALLYADRFRLTTAYDETNFSLPSSVYELRAIDDGDLGALCNELGYDYFKTERRWGFGDDCSRHFYTTQQRCFRGFLKEHYGTPDLKVDRVDTQDGTYWLVWDGKELDKFAGVKDAEPLRQTVRHVVDGEVYGYVVSLGDEEESCWGFIGEHEYCLGEAVKVADTMADAAASSRSGRLKALIRHHVPLGYRSAILEAYA